jgi:uncharacterized Zn-binding protein involved in type VI secretion
MDAAEAWLTVTLAARALEVAPCGATSPVPDLQSGRICRELHISCHEEAARQSTSTGAMPGQGRLGDKANVPLDAHGCPACPHPGIGPAIQGSPDVNVNKRPALRVDDPGMHAACCGTNTWTATVGSQTVFINGKGAHRMGDQNRHCGGMGQLIEGSPNVIVGESSGGGGGAGSGSGSGGGSTAGAGGSSSAGSGSGGAPGGSSGGASTGGRDGQGGDETAGKTGADEVLPANSIEIELIDEDGQPVAFAAYQITDAAGEVFRGTLDADGHARTDNLQTGDCTLVFPDLNGDEWSKG